MKNGVDLYKATSPKFPYPSQDTCVYVVRYSGQIVGHKCWTSNTLER